MLTVCPLVSSLGSCASEPAIETLGTLQFIRTGDVARGGFSSLGLVPCLLAGTSDMGILRRQKVSVGIN